jgi:hypothetical protein
MENITNTLRQVQLNNSERQDVDENRKWKIRYGLGAIPPGFQYAAIDNIVADEIEDFNREIINIEHEIGDLFNEYGKKGSLNCGNKLADYTEIRRIACEHDQQIDNETNYAIILHFILMPIVSLPEANDISNLENKLGEKTFSKVCLNLAVKYCLERLNFVSGYWTKRQNVDFPSPHVGV